MTLPADIVKAYLDPLVGFAGERVHTRGFVHLLTTFGVGKTYQTLTVRFLLVEANTSYNVLIGRRTLNGLGAIVSTPHMATKFPLDQGDIITIKAEPKIAWECYAQSLRLNLYTVKRTDLLAATFSTVFEIFETSIDEECNRAETIFAKLEIFKCFNMESKYEDDSKDEIQVDLDLRAEFEENRPTFDELVVLVQLGQQPNQCTKIRRVTNKLLKNEIERVIIANDDLFAWSPAHMPGIDPDFICHKLAILPQAKLAAQRK